MKAKEVKMLLLITCEQSQYPYFSSSHEFDTSVHDENERTRYSSFQMYVNLVKAVYLAFWFL